MTTENVAILFTDIVGSTELSQRLSAELADEVRRGHFTVLRQAIADTGGTEVKNLGDGVMVVFASSSAALDCGVAMQQLVERANRGGAESIGLRVGISWGEVDRDEDDYFGDPVVGAARLCARCERGQVPASDIVPAMAGRRSKIRHQVLGDLELKGLPEPVATVEVLWEPLEAVGGGVPLPDRLAVRNGVQVVGRDDELQVFADGFKRVSGDGARELLLVSGEAGQGKTTFVAEAARTAFDQGAYVLLGRCEEDLVTPYQLFAEVHRGRGDRSPGRRCAVGARSHGRPRDHRSARHGRGVGSWAVGFTEEMPAPPPGRDSRHADAGVGNDRVMTQINGWTAPGFEGVRDVFQGNFDQGAEDGAAFAAYHRGRKVVDLWGGVADTTTGRPWYEDTMALTYSTTKGATAMCANRLAEQGLLDVDAPVMQYWPEFAQSGKDAVTVADLLAHRAGLPWIDGTMSFDDALAWDPVVEALARQSPAWEPGTDHGYHAVTFGYLVGEVVRRITGRTLGTYFRDEVAGPLGADWYVGLPASEEHRVARLVPGPDGSPFDMLGSLGAGSGGDPAMQELLTQLAPYIGPDGTLKKALEAPGGAFSSQEAWEDPRLHAAEIPAANGICDARSLARVYGACVGDVDRSDGGPFRVLSSDQVDKALVQQTAGPDRVLLGMDIQWGMGFMLNVGVIALAGLGGPRSFGHFGMGGSVGWADPDLELGLGYVMNRMSLGATGDSRSADLIHATLAAIGGGG